MLFDASHLITLSPHAGRGLRACGAALALSILTCTPVFAAGSVAAGRQKAQQCQVCHGLDGLSKMPLAPNIAGSPAEYLEKAINEFRKGVRKNEMMTIVVEKLTDQDVADLAAYYAAIEVTAKPPK